MSGTKDILYVKADSNVEVQKPEVTIGEIVTMECSNAHLVSRVRSIQILKFPDKGSRRCVISILRILQIIHQNLPGVDVQTIGVPDIIVTYEEPKKPKRIQHICKIIGVAVITFSGSAFSIMAFNNDVATGKLFDQIYEFFTGVEPSGFTVLELMYSIGLVIGILLFFDHFSGKKFTVDPTPMEVEMRLYENDIQTTLVEAYNRKGKEIDVGHSNTAGKYRP